MVVEVCIRYAHGGAGLRATLWHHVSGRFRMMVALAQVPQTVELGMPNGAHRFDNGTNRNSAGGFEVHQTRGEWRWSSWMQLRILSLGGDG